ncbi:hypothetical protein [Paraburkholderia tagetis]|uniref:Glycine zipper domain-containing protein n=1 Tax=Paraburkholderia tagetis TaxID=2913261 RepID=A0A9X1UM83_9BURK|nr:hypothetical protein [Paraburkholderia tagetis]MCG5077978.1 hypothetical protein [Paraburkholderia tagetis]
MSQIVAARFTTFDAADAAKSKLLMSGFVAEDVAEFYVNPGGQHDRFPLGGDEFADPQARPAGLGATGGGEFGAIVGALVAGVLTIVLFHSLLVLPVATAVGACIGTLGGALLMTRGEQRTDQPAVSAVPHERESGVLLAVHVNADQQFQAARVLREANGEDIEEFSGLWKDGKLADFDPTKMVNPVKDGVSRPARSNAATN